MNNSFALLKVIPSGVPQHRELKQNRSYQLGYGGCFTVAQPSPFSAFPLMVIRRPGTATQQPPQGNGDFPLSQFFAGIKVDQLRSREGDVEGIVGVGM